MRIAPLLDGPLLEAPYVLTDCYGRILMVDEETARRLGVPAVRLVGRWLVHRLVEKSRAPFRSALNRARTLARWAPLAVRVRTGTGDLVDASLTVLGFVGVPLRAVVFRIQFEG